jgi:hypothetical protein
MADIYDQGIDWLVEHPHRIEETWSDAAFLHENHPLTLDDHWNGEVLRRNPGTVLFMYAVRRSPHQEGCGCLTLIRSRVSPHGLHVDGVDGPNFAMEQEIRNDERLATSVDDAAFAALSPAERRTFLEPFAEWQRRFDEELPRQ